MNEPLEVATAEPQCGPAEPAPAQPAAELSDSPAIFAFDGWGMIPLELQPS